MKVLLSALVLSSICFASTFTDGNNALQERNEELAYEIFIDNAKKNDPRSMHALGTMNMKGLIKNGIRYAPDHKKAFEWFLKAAKAGDMRGQIAVGVLYYKGIGVNADYAKALKWSSYAAEKGNLDAIHNVGHFKLYPPKKYEADVPGAIEVLKFAASHNFTKSQIALSNLYLLGEHPLTKDRKKESYKYALMFEDSDPRSFKTITTKLCSQYLIGCK